MKTNRLLRMLSFLGFLLLLAPFYDSCDIRMVEATDAACADSTAVAIDSIKNDKTEISKIDVDSISNPAAAEETSFYKKTYDFIVDEDSSHGYDLALMFISSSPKEIINEIKDVANKKDWYKDLGFFISFLFDFIILISFSLLILSFFKKHNLYTKLALVNSILIITTFCYIVFLEKTFHDWHQIKWGYYAFIITNLLIFYYSKKNKIQT